MSTYANTTLAAIRAYREWAQALRDLAELQAHGLPISTTLRARVEAARNAAYWRAVAAVQAAIAWGPRPDIRARRIVERIGGKWTPYESLVRDMLRGRIAAA